MPLFFYESRKQYIQCFTPVTLSRIQFIYKMKLTDYRGPRGAHSSVLAWRIPGTAGPGGLPSTESHRVGHDWRDLAAAAEEPDGASGKEPTCQCRRHKRCVFNPWVGKIPWRRKWQPTPVYVLGESHGQRSLMGYSPWGCKESNMTEACVTCRGTTRRMKSKMLAVGVGEKHEQEKYQF